MKYRADIDGLRAIAVVSVVVYHVWPAILPGGFVGVDIFFVISGYLITLQILRELELQKFSVVEFYRRRIKRIAPAMLTVLLVTVVLAEVLMRPLDSEAVARSAIWSLASMTNVFFWLYEDSSYFAAATDQLPLLHYWSLGVEEQFYLFWPLILLMVGGAVRKPIFLLVLVVVIVASFVFGQYFHATDPSFVYYMLPARAGELMLGAIAAAVVHRHGEWLIRSWARSLFATIGFALVMLSLFFVSADRVFPGFQAIYPSLGTAILILAGHSGPTWAGNLLKLRPMVWIGLISYSAYLWHWPILAFIRYGGFDITLAIGVGVLALTGLLATASYRFVEIPFRRSRSPFVPIFARQYLIPAAMISVLCAISLKSDGNALRMMSPDYAARLEAVREGSQPAFQFDFVCQEQRLNRDHLRDEKCVLGRKSGFSQSVILFGDSNAAQYVGMLGEIAGYAGFEFRNAAVGSCPPVRRTPENFVDSRRLADCMASLDEAWREIQAFDVVILAANWTYYSGRSSKFFDTFFATVRNLQDESKHVIILGKAPIISGYDRLCREKALSFPFLDCGMEPVLLDDEVLHVNAVLKEFADSASNVDYYDANKYLCPSNRCAVFKPDGTANYYDAGHITFTASAELGKAIIESGGVPDAFLGISKAERTDTHSD